MLIALLSHPSQLINTLQLILCCRQPSRIITLSTDKQLGEEIAVFCCLVLAKAAQKKDTIFRYKLFDLLSGLMSYSMFRGSHPYALGCKPSTFFIFFLRCAK